jgi:hypothetical protein
MVSRLYRARQLAPRDALHGAMTVSAGFRYHSTQANGRSSPSAEAEIYGDAGNLRE